MSLLQDPDYVISHLRASYLQSIRDGVGERVIKPSHLYITKGGSNKLNWAATTLLSMASAGSPPIPTSTLGLGGELEGRRERDRRSEKGPRERKSKRESGINDESRKMKGINRISSYRLDGKGRRRRKEDDLGKGDGSENGGGGDWKGINKEVNKEVNKEANKNIQKMLNGPKNMPSKSNGLRQIDPLSELANDISSDDDDDDLSDDDFDADLYEDNQQLEDEVDNEDDDDDDGDDDIDDDDDDDDDDYDYDYDYYDDYNSVANDNNGILNRSRDRLINFKKKFKDEDSDLNLDHPSDDDTLTTVYENISDSDLLSDFGIREENSKLIKDRNDSNTSGLSSSAPLDTLITNQQSIGGLSAMSQEDDSDIEEDLKDAVRQIKRRTLGGIIENNSTSNSLDLLLDSKTSSPKVKSTRVRATTVGTTPVSNSTNQTSTNPRKMILRQRSLDVGLNNLVGNSKFIPTVNNIGSSVSSTSRRMSNPAPPARTLSSRMLNGNNQQLEQEHRPVVSRRNTDASLSTTNLIPEIFPSDEQLARQELKRQEQLTKDQLNQLNPYLQRSKSASNSSLNLPILPPPPHTAKLSALIKAKLSSFDNPLEQYISASGRSERKPCRLKIYMPSCKDPKVPWEVIVRTDANVASAIGFALYCYQQTKRLPPLPEDLCDANKWNLRIVEDDGEPDEDFPALDRTRIISAYSFDEFALVEATAEQSKENDKITPNTRKPTMTKSANVSRAGSVSNGGIISRSGSTTSTKALTTTSSNVTSQSQSNPSSSTTTSPSEVVLKIFQFPFNELISPLFWSATLSINTKIDQLIDIVCQDKLLDPNNYILKIAGSRILAINSLDLTSLQGKYTLELTPKRIITTENGYDTTLLTLITKRNPSFSSNINSTVTRKRLGTSSSNTSNSSNIFATLDNRTSTSASHNPSSILPEGFLNGSSAGYQKYIIWRRQPMSFISRHERVLAIDGEYVHIMPSDDKTFFDSPKTSSFHIGQIIKCKQSNKVPINFKVVVMKTNGPKRYDLEASSVAESAEIVTKLRALSQKYRQN